MSVLLFVVVCVTEGSEYCDFCNSFGFLDHLCRAPRNGLFVELFDEFFFGADAGDCNRYHDCDYRMIL